VRFNRAQSELSGRIRRGRDVIHEFHGPYRWPFIIVMFGADIDIQLGFLFRFGFLEGTVPTRVDAWKRQFIARRAISRFSGRSITISRARPRTWWDHGHNRARRVKLARNQSRNRADGSWYAAWSWEGLFAHGAETSSYFRMGDKRVCTGAMHGRHAQGPVFIEAEGYFEARTKWRREHLPILETDFEAKGWAPRRGRGDRPLDYPSGWAWGNPASRPREFDYFRLGVLNFLPEPAAPWPVGGYRCGPGRASNLEATGLVYESPGLLPWTPE